MTSEIAEILDRMNKENAKLHDYKKQYMNCIKAKKARNLHIEIVWYEEKEGQKRIKVDGYEQKKAVLDLVEAHYIEQGRECKRKLEEMVEEMKGVSE